MEEAENIKHFTGRGLPDNALKASMADGTPYVLPPWRVNDIILLAIETLSDVDYYRDDFDYKKMIREQGIKIKKFSAFSPENLEKFRKILQDKKFDKYEIFMSPLLLKIRKGE